MLKTDPFYSTRLKVERANHHIRDLERQLTDYSNSHPHVITIKEDPYTKRFLIYVNFPDKPPPEMALTIGDAIHNLRTALDHMMWEMIGRDHGSQHNNLYFPMGNNRVNFEATCQGIITPSQNIRDTLKRLEAFPSGKGDSLYTIHLLDRAEKHTVLTPMIKAVMVSRLVVFGPGDGQPIIDIADLPILGDGQATFSCPPGSRIQNDNHSKATADIIFGEVEAVKSQPVIPTLRQLAHAANDTIDIVVRSII